MSKTTNEKTASNTAAAPSDVAAAAAAQAEMVAKGYSEADTFAARVCELVKDGSKLGPIALERLAIKFGESANKLGRPTPAAGLALLMGLADNPASHNSRDSLARRAVKAQRETLGADKENKLRDGKEIKPCATFKAKASGSGDKSTATVKFNSPVAVEIAAG